MSTWTERLEGWINWWLGLAFGMAFLVTAMAITLRVGPSKEKVDEMYHSLPDEAQSNPLVAKLYGRLTLHLLNEKTAAELTLSGFHELADPLVETLIDPLMNIPVLKPEEAFEKAKTLLKLTIGKDITIGAAGVIAEGASLGQLDTLTNFYNNINSKIGFGGPATMLLSSPIEMGLIKPLSYGLHAKFRNVIPSVGEAITMHNKGDLEDVHLKNTFAWSGYYPWYEAAVRKGATREPFIYDLLRMSEGEEFDPGWLWAKAVRRQYSHEDATKLVKGQLAKYYLTYRRAVAGSYGRLHKEGFRSDDELSATLKGFGFSDSVTNLMVAKDKLDYEYDYKMDLRAAYRDGFKKDLLTEGEFRTCLAGIGMVDERIGGEVLRETMRKTPKVTEKIIVERQGIKITSKPSGAHIYMDGTDLMLITPETIDTSAGRHTMDLYVPGYKVWSGEFSVPADRFIEEKVELEKFEIPEEVVPPAPPPPPPVVKQGVKLSSKPSYAKIYVDGEDTHKLTPETIDLSPGTYWIRLETPGYEPLVTSREIWKGKYIEVREELEKIE